MVKTPARVQQINHTIKKVRGSLGFGLKIKSEPTFNKMKAHPPNQASKNIPTRYLKIPPLGPIFSFLIFNF
jgi:hypothetical protein